MQTSATQLQSKAIKGMAVLGPLKARPLQLPSLPQITQIRYADASAAAGETWSITVVDDLTGQEYSVSFTSGATVALSLDAALAAVQGDAKLNSLFSGTEDGVDDLVLTARHPNRSYTITAEQGAGTATDTITEPQAPGGDGLEFGQLVVQGAEDDSFGVVTTATVLRDIVGGLVRYDANHFKDLPIDDTLNDVCVVGKHYPIAEEVEFWVEVEEAVAPGDDVWIRLDGEPGAWRASTTGTALDVSAIARWTSSAGAGELAKVKIKI